MNYSTIQLYTPDYKWKYNALKQGDPHFSTFLSAIEEATGELPNELELSSSVAEIIEEEWGSYVHLYKLSKRMRDTIGMWPIIGEASLMTREIFLEQVLRMEGIIHIHDPVHSRDYYYRDVDEDLALPLLSSLNRILHIVNHVCGWEIFVRVDETIPQNDRVQHLASMAKILHECGIRLNLEYVSAEEYEYPTYMCRLHLGDVRKDSPGVVPTTMEYVEAVLQSYVSRHCNTEQDDEVVLDKAPEMLILALIHNQRISRRDYGLYDILWQDVRLLAELLVNQVQRTSSLDIIVGLADLLQGLPTDAPMPPLHVSCMTSPSTHGKLMYSRVLCVRDKDVGKLYHILLHTVPDTTGMEELGLRNIGKGADLNSNLFSSPTSPCPLIQGIHRSLIYNFIHLRPCLEDHERYSNSILRPEVDLQEKDFPALVRFLASTFIGKEGLALMSRLIKKNVATCSIPFVVLDKLSRVCNRYVTFALSIDEFLANPTDEWGPFLGGLHNLQEMKELLAKKLSH